MRKILPFLFIFTAVLFFYYPALTTFFAQDDFFHIKISQTDGSLLGFLNLFGFYPFEQRGIAFYRPIFREIFFNIFYSLFGLNHIPYRVFVLAVHFINIVLVYVFLQRVFERRELSLFTAFFYGTTAANVATLYYLTGGIQSLGATMFILLTLIFFFDWLNTGDVKRRYLSFATAALALASHELSVVTPFLMAGLIWLQVPGSKMIRYMLHQLWPLFLLLFLYLYLEFFIIGFSSGEQQYQVVLSIKKAVNTFVWYGVWAWGLPEMLIDFVKPGLELNPSLMRYWGRHFTVIFPAFFVTVVLFFSFFVLLFLRARSLFADKRFWFFAFWFPAGIAPVILLPLHKSTYYLTPVLPAFWAVIGALVLSAYSHIARKRLAWLLVLLGAFVGTTALLSLVSAKLGGSTYWAASRGKLAQKLISDVADKYPSLPSGSAVYFANDPNYPFVANNWGGTSKQASFVLNGSDALQLFYKDPTLRVFYEDLGGVPAGFAKEKIYPLVAQIQ